VTVAGVAAAGTAIAGTATAGTATAPDERTALVALTAAACVLSALIYRKENGSQVAAIAAIPRLSTVRYSERRCRAGGLEGVDGALSVMTNIVGRAVETAVRRRSVFSSSRRRGGRATISSRGSTVVHSIDARLDRGVPHSSDAAVAG